MDRQEFNVLGLMSSQPELVDFYCASVMEYYLKYGKTSELHIDSLVLVYRITKNDRIFALLFLTHKRLLIGISHNIFNKYKSHLYGEDLYDLQAMIFNEFFRRVLFYSVPSIAPFSKWVKIYMTQWSNSYIKLTVRYNQKVCLSGDINDYSNQE